MDFDKKIEKHQCRACYNSKKGLRELNTLTKCAGGHKSYAELFKEVSNINIFDNLYDGSLPQLICESCARRLKTAHAFILQTQKVNDHLTLLARKLETNKELICLNEPPVDILPSGDIKSENVEDGMDLLGVFEPQCFVELKEEPLQKLSAYAVSKDVLSIQKRQGYSTEVGNYTTQETNNEANAEVEENIDLFNEDKKYSESDTGWQEDDDIPLSDAKNKKKYIPKPKKLAYNADDDIAVPCSECNKIFSNSKALTRHKRNTHIPEEQKCTCPLCGRRFSRSCNMYKHMRTFHGPDSVPLKRKRSTKERTFQCEKCERNYTKKSHLNVHIKEKHSNDESNTEKDSPQNSELNTGDDDLQKKGKQKKRYEVRSLCSICGSSFASRTHLVVHMRRHTGERPFKCDLCERAYPRLSELVCHRRIHTGEKPFKCKICDKAFRVWSKMSNHMRSHTDIRPYKCKQCERSFKYSKDLNIHFRIHTGERPYKCNICGSTFTQSNTLKAHRSKLGHMDDSTMIVKNNAI